MGDHIDRGSDDLAPLATRLTMDDNKVSIADRGSNHGITFDLKHEEFALSEDGFPSSE